MDERDMEQERQNGKRKGWGIERKMFLVFFKTFTTHLCVGWNQSLKKKTSFLS
jgi:hypothetical protein